MERIEKRMEKMERFMKPSSTHSAGLKLVPSGRGEGVKKNPQPSPERLGILPASTLHSLILEDLLVKPIQTRFSDFPDLNLPSHPELVLRAVASLLRHSSRNLRDRDHSGGSVLDSPPDDGSRGSLRLDTTQQSYLLFKRFEKICQGIGDCFWDPLDSLKKFHA